MSADKAYRVIRGAIKLPRNPDQIDNSSQSGKIMQGELLPAGVFGDDDIRSWINEGRIESAEVTQEQVEEAAAIRAANPFAVDPAIMVGKTMEDLIIMVLEIKPEYDTDSLEDEQAAVRLLTSGWDPKYAQTIAPVNDRSRPEAIALHKLEQTAEGGSATSASDSELSEQARAGLEAARLKAQAPSPNE